MEEVELEIFGVIRILAVLRVDVLVVAMFYILMISEIVG